MQKMIKENLDLKGLKFKIHVFPTKENRYKQLRAKNSFLDKLDERWIEHWQAKKYNTHDSFPKFENWTSVEEKIHNSMKEKMIELHGLKFANEVYPDFTKKFHNSIWDFFDYISYNYKDKKKSNIDTLIFVEKIKNSNPA